MSGYFNSNMDQLKRDIPILFDSEYVAAALPQSFFYVLSQSDSQLSA
jgi:hypothetical protein